MSHEPPVFPLNESTSPALKVCSRVDHPIWSHDEDAGDEGRKLLASLQLLEGVCRRMVIIASKREQLDDEMMRSLQSRAATLHAEVLASFGAIYSFDNSLSEYMDRTRLSILFPKTRAIISDPPKSLPRTRVAMDTYFQHFAMLNQLVALARQIKHDLFHLENHKYVAHQVAMLYQCLTNAGDPVTHIKQRVEGRFTELKEVTQPRADKAPVKLPVHLAAWVDGMLDDVVATVERLPRIYKDPLIRPTKFLTQMQSEV